MLLAHTAAAAPTPVPLLTASPFAILAGTALSDVPTSPITGSVGLSPAAGSFMTGLTCAEVTGTIYAVDATGPAPCSQNNPGLLTVAKNDATTAYNDAAGRTPDTTYITGDNQLGGLTLVAGVYRVPHAATANLIGNLTLSGNADSVWIFQATSDLVFAAASTITFTGSAQACNVFWQVGTAATLHSTANIVGTILAHDDISLDNGVTLTGRLLAGDQASHAGAVTLIHDTITAPTTCVTQASLDSASALAVAQAAAAAQAAATQAAAAAQSAAAAQAAADQATAAAAAADVATAQAAAARATAAAAAAVQAAAAAQAAAVRAAAVRAAAAHAKVVVARTAATKAAKAATVARAAAARAATARRIALKRAAVRTAVVQRGFTG
jgi:hypothetical protein